MNSSPPQQVSELIERFARNEASYTSAQYNETQLRQEFINPFFEALGWDVRNVNGNAEAYKDVIHEDAIKIGSAVKAPDYSFRIGGTRKFFVEAKKPSVEISDNEDAAFQLRRYAWSANLSLSILTNFKEFAVYDCRMKPFKNDKASLARISYFSYKDYPQQWAYLVSIISKDSILKGSFDRYAESSKLKKGTAKVDDAFLEEIELWRNELAHRIAIRNTRISVRELNFAVQRTIDRIIFLRICEDRGMEQYGRLQALMNGTNIYKRLYELFQRADERYNSGLFHFKREKERAEEPDDLTPVLNIDDQPIKDIINRLYYPESPYEFSVLPADILGQVYEQFLGKVIRLTEGHHAKVEEKPEVRKAGGIYYTPTYIVNYIVKNTVGRLLGQDPDISRHSRENGNPASSSGVIPAKAGIQSSVSYPPLTGGPEEMVKAGSTEKTNKKPITPKDVSKLRILDPACGSGSFLLGAYQYLLDWHLAWYVNDGTEKYVRSAKPILYQAQGGNYRLTTYERKRILLNNIYGVDIDPQAVEVTKLSLLLKVLEGENSQTLETQLKLFHDRALPDLGNNIKCGNSLIGPDFYQQQSLNLFSDDERLRINAFDWNTEFKDIMASGGFDAVIGNPPYGADFSESIIDYLKTSFKTFVWRGESYLVFVERGIQLLKLKGLIGYIIPDTYLNLGFTQSLRTFLLQHSELCEIVSLPSKVFSGGTVDTTLLLAKKAAQTSNFHKAKVLVKVFNKKSSIQSVDQPSHQFFMSTKVWFEQNAFNIYSDAFESKIISRIEGENEPLLHLGEIFYGIKVYQVGKGSPRQTKEILERKPFTSDKKENEAFMPFFDGKHIGRYELLWKRNNWLKYGPWLAEPRQPQKYEGEKILIRKIVGQTLIATYTPETSYCNTLLFVLKIKANVSLSYLYFLGILNSKFIGWYFRKKFQISADDTFPQIMIRDILQFPIPKYNKSHHDKMVSLVDQMLSLNKQLPSVKTEHEKTALQRQIDTTDRQIDELVYQLYGITDEERKIIER